MRDFGAQIQQTCRFAARYRRCGRVEGPAFRACPFLHDRGHRERRARIGFPCVGVRRGLRRADGRRTGLLARAVVVIDKAGRVVYTELVPEITEEPDYDKAVEAVKAN